jgi:predicted HicB family RNase H-like nuclease
MTYKGYTAIVTYDDRDRIFHGRLADTYDDVYFEGASVEALERALHEALDDYLAYCQETGREPAKPFSGRLNIRMDADLHRRAHLAARRKGISLNTLIREAISKEIE